MKPPAFQLYADDLLAGTINLTDAEMGFYMRLLCAQWSKGGLPNDDAELLAYSKGGLVEPSLNRVKAKFKPGPDGLLRNERLESERAKQIAYREGQKAKGLTSAQARFNRASTEPQPSTQPKGNSPSPSPSPSFVNIGFVALKVANRIISNQDSWSYDNCKVDVNKLKSKPLASVIEPHAGKLTENQIIKAWIDAVFVAHGAQVDGLANNATAYCITVFKEKMKG